MNRENAMIGIIGGYGSVGRWAVKSLSKHMDEIIKVGGRSKTAYEMCVERHQLKHTEFAKVDFADLNSVRQFAKGCRLILNCAGPTFGRSLKVADTVLGLGSCYVDVGFDNHMDELFKRYNNRNLLCKAGAIPGLSGLLPRYLANKLGQAEQVVVYYSALGKFSKTASEDYLNGIFGSGIAVTGKRKEVERKLLPLSSQESYLYPYYDSECDYVSRSLQPASCKWFMALEGESSNMFMSNAGELYLQNQERAIAGLCDASYADTLSNSEYAGFVVQTSGIGNGMDMCQTLYLKAPSPEYLTGTATAAAVLLTDKYCGLTGGSELSMIQDVEGYLEILKEIGTAIEIRIETGTIADLLIQEEGEI